MGQLVRKLLTQLQPLAFLVAGLALLIGPFVLYWALTRPDTSSLLGHLKGARTASGQYLIDEDHGSFAGMRLGMSFSAAKKLLPASHRCTSQPPNEFSYCNGDGLIVSIVSACGLFLNTAIRCPSGNATGRLAEIQISAEPGYAITPGMSDAIRNLIPDSQKLVTVRGLRLGDSVSHLMQAYTIASRVPFLRNGCESAALGSAYTTVTRRTTVVFTVVAKAVAGVSLLAGREPDVCAE